MGKDADRVQTQCGTYQLAANKAKSYAMFTSKDWRSPFRQYLTEGILPQKHSERYKLKRLVTHYLFHDEVLFKKRYDGDPLRCLGPKDAKEMIKKCTQEDVENTRGRKSYIDACCKWVTTSPL